jgi:hypothetical protein
MNRLIALLLGLAPLLFGCASHHVTYRAATLPESTEMKSDLLDVYPGDIRRNLELYTNAGVGWAGIIVRTEAHTGTDGMIHAVTTFEHHYFDWQEDRRFGRVQLNLSPRGEGIFRMDWVLRGKDAEGGVEATENFASPGKLAIVYGVPEKVEDGTVVLRYRFLRMVDEGGFNTNRLDYGRFGEPFRYIDNPPGQPKP